MTMQLNKLELHSRQFRNWIQPIFFLEGRLKYRGEADSCFSTRGGGFSSMEVRLKYPGEAYPHTLFVRNGKIMIIDIGTESFLVVR